MTIPAPATGFPYSRVLVTGGAGFIGSALVWALNRRGVERIVVADRLGTDAKWRNLAPLAFEDYLEADDLLPRLERHALGRFDCVLHMGACSATTERDASYLARNNFEFTKSLGEWALGRGARFVYASSAATYGDGAGGMEDFDDEADALQRLRPLNAYGYSKQLTDLWAARKGVLDRIVGCKFFNVFGPNEDHKGDMRSLVNKAYGQVLETGRVRLFRSHRPDYRDGEQRRDFLYVKDCVEMTLFLAAHPRAAGLYNLGSGVASTWLELADALFAAMGRTPEVEFVDMPAAIRDKYQYYTRADVGKLREAGYAAPATPLRDAVRDYVAHYLAHDRRLGDEG
ncbi:ADP-L-glycero-D-manno-heptose-6-epimerase [Gemmatimonadetes bacterium T265]|nr:ADP-L-glycero-D-manno-heptose-6-epimerase [Gemmatimonadetes bacterium T265]